MKDENSIQPEITDEAFSLYSEGYLVSCEKSIEMVLTKVSLHNGTVLLCGFLKSVFFSFTPGCLCCMPWRIPARFNAVSR